MIIMWLDDIRPMPSGFSHHVKTVEEAKQLLLTGDVIWASLDHDLGACEECLKKENFEGVMPHCEHFGSGYTLVCWMEETDNWPAQRPYVHSANPAGKLRMNQVIEKKYGY